jgi:uncharacterized protein YodC (DUF2158 family)
MSEHHFEDGDIVRLKAGGENMTVDSFDPETGECACSWITGADRRKGRFTAVALTPVLATLT